MEKTFKVGEIYRTIRPRYNSGIERCDQNEWYEYYIVTKKTATSIWIQTLKTPLKVLGRYINDEHIPGDYEYCGEAKRYSYHVDSNGREVCSLKGHFIFREFCATFDELESIPKENQVWH